MRTIVTIALTLQLCTVTTTACKSEKREIRGRVAVESQRRPAVVKKAYAGSKKAMKKRRIRL
ncbi:MAG: hypothetical protein QW359_07925 [Metallosphaera sp.]